MSSKRPITRSMKPITKSIRPILVLDLNSSLTSQSYSCVLVDGLEQFRIKMRSRSSMYGIFNMEEGDRDIIVLNESLHMNAIIALNKFGVDIVIHTSIQPIIHLDSSHVLTLTNEGKVITEEGDEGLIRVCKKIIELLND